MRASAKSGAASREPSVVSWRAESLRLPSRQIKAEGATGDSRSGIPDQRHWRISLVGAMTLGVEELK